MVSQEQFNDRLRRIYENDPSLNEITLENALAPVARIDKLKLDPGTRVLFRCDLDVPLKEGAVVESSRLASIAKSVVYASEQGWIPIIMGHLGRDPENTLSPVAETLSEIIGKSVGFVAEWIDPETGTLDSAFRDDLDKFEAGQIIMLENTRRYPVERMMWKMKAANFADAVPSLYKLATEIYDHISPVLVNEALAASNFDFSSAVLPLVMDQTAYGFYISEEMTEHVKGARESELVIFSGLKIDKLDDLEKIVDRGLLKMIISAGSLAMALKKARAELDGTEFSMGLAEEDQGAKIFIPQSRIEQAKALLTKCKKQNIEIVLPVDFVLGDGTISETIPKGQAQLDIGPKTRELFAEKLQTFAKNNDSPALFYNGVFGKFEDEKFAEGTKSFIAELKTATEAGARTYVGGGEGRMALMKYGDLNDVAHAFTAGGTILKSLGDKHIAYVKANYLQSTDTLTPSSVN
jgi:phosphoglycerate kinase